MLVKNWMSRPVVTVSGRASMQMAGDLMKKHKIRSLPVLRQEKLIGLLTDRDIKRASASDATTLDAYELAFILQGVKVEQIMTADPVTIQFDSTLSEAADLLLNQKLEALPVMAGEETLVGILSPSDLSRAFLMMTSFGQRGLELGVRVMDEPGAAMTLVDAVRHAGGRLASLVVVDSPKAQGLREVYLHIYRLKPENRAGLFKEIQQKGELVYIVDHVTQERRILAV